jgi:hypothetical protein
MRRFMLFEIASGQGPEILPWFNRAPAQQNAVIMRDNGTDHDLRICIVNVFAFSADVAFMRVAFGYAADKIRSG